MAKYEKYAEYQDSGVKWLGSVPSHWIVTGFRKYLESTVDYRGKTPDKVDEGVFLVTARNIKNGIIDYSLSQEYVAFKDYDEIMSRGKPVLGDVLFTTEAPLGEVAQIDNVNIALAQRIIKFRGKKDILDNAYLKYFILSREFQDSLMTFATGSTALGIKAERMGYLQQCIPPIIEQTQIANFLDHETTQIDTLIAKQQKLIELLKEKRQAVISHAVTKGLNPDVNMKDSGVEWLGKVPEHWGVTRLKHLIWGNLVYGANEAAEDDNPNNPRYIRITDMNNDGSLDPNTFRSLPYHIAESYLLEDGDILLARSGATVGKSFLFKNEFGTSCFAGYLIRARANTKKLNPKFAYWFFQSNSYWKYVSGSQIQATIQNVSAEKYGDLYLSVPEISVQKRISNFLECEINKIDNLIAKAESAIQLMQERRTALISSAVTGKIDVRHHASRPSGNDKKQTEGI